MDLGLQSKVAVVTGASRGIGKAIATSLAREGAHVWLVARGEEALLATLDELRRSGATAYAVVADVSSSEGARQAMATVLEGAGRLDILVNNVGGSGGAGAFDSATETQWRSVVDQNLYAAVWCSQEAVQAMKASGGGVVVHLHSIYGREYCSSAPYAAAKAALSGLTKEMAIDLARFSIRVNAVAPGSILFPGGSWDRRLQREPERIARMIETDLPWGRFGRPEEVADVVTFLCSSRASWVTGAILPVDGGQGRAF